MCLEKYREKRINAASFNPSDVEDGINILEELC